MTEKNTVKTNNKAENSAVNFNLPKAPKDWAGVKMAKLNKAESEAVKALPEYKGFEIWLAPFKTPDKNFRVAPKQKFFIVHIVTWGRKFIARAGKTKVLNIAELAE